MRYVVVIERTGDGYTAHVPDLPGCIAAGATRDEVRCLIMEAIALHLAGLRADGALMPPPKWPDEQGAESEPNSEDPFIAFTEWAGDADASAYADL